MRIVAAALLPALLIAVPAFAAPMWRTPVQLSTSPRSVEPHLAVAPAGEAVVVWDREIGSVCATAPENPACVHVLEARSRSGGAWDAAAAELMRPGVGPDPRVAVNDAGDAVAVWRHDIGEPRVLQAAWRPRTTRRWQEPVDLSDAGAMGGQDVEIDAAGNVIAVWTIDLGGGMRTQAEVRPVLSGSWGAPVTLSRAGETAVGAPQLAIDAGGGAVAVWVRAPGVVQAAARPPGGTWAPAVDLATGREPQLATDAAGNAVVVWSVAGGGVQSAYRPAGAGWGAPADVSRAAGSAPSVGIDANGNAVAVWLGGAGPHVRSARRALATGAWSPPLSVSAVGVAVSDPRVAVDARGNAVAVWTRGGTRAMRSALRPRGIGVWVAPTRLSAAGVPTAEPLVRIDANGRALAVWTRRDGGGSLVESSEFAGAGPLLTSLEVPARVRQARSIRFSVRPAAWSSPLVGPPQWRFGDGAGASGGTVSHAYARAGTFTVTVTQSDSAGATTSASRAVRVLPP